MDRELVFAFLVAALCGCALLASAWWPSEADHSESRLPSERQSWRQLWLPFAPAALVFAALCGWALAEPASAEPVPKAVMLTALPFALIFIRAAWRATRSLTISHEHLTIATVGFFRPRIVVSRNFSDLVDAAALAAALEHERAHARHRDPLRILLAQLATELLWPAPAATARLQAWKRALEISRDEEARSHGAAGPDLAAAILTSLRLSQSIVPPAVAATLTDDNFIKQRVTRLLQPIEVEIASEGRIGPVLFALSIAIPLAMVIGVKFGERLIGTLLMSA